MSQPIIPVTRPYLPSKKKLTQYIDGIYECNWLTNNGPLVQELTQRLEDYLGVDNLLLVANGTLALQIAYRTLGVTDVTHSAQPEAITTPFTFIATASSLKWEGIQPVFVDINPDTWNLDPKLIEAAITPQTRVLVPVHVFGNPCEVEAIQAIADKHQLKVIYDAAHTFGVKYKGESILKWGDAATLSFHATKVFHTIEGGAIVFRRKEDLEKAKKLINFGIAGPEIIEELGINAKMNEFQAAMGLCVLDEMKINLAARKEAWFNYSEKINNHFILQRRSENSTDNHGYFPILPDGAEQTRTLFTKLKEQGIQARRYFSPSLDSLVLFAESSKCNVSQDIASRVLCLPFYPGVSVEKVVAALLGTSEGKQRDNS